MNKRILIACENSQTVMSAFRNHGFDAWSCDLKPAVGAFQEFHIQGDVFEVINDNWLMMIAHPPCHKIAVSGVHWLSHPDDSHLPFADRRSNPMFPNRRQEMLDAVAFAIRLHDSPIQHIAIENPIGMLSSLWRKPDQIIQPFYFGDGAKKSTCLWLKNLPKLVHTRTPNLFNDPIHVPQDEPVFTESGRKYSRWHSETSKIPNKDGQRQTERSKTFKGIATAMSDQWCNFLTQLYENNQI